MDVTNIGSCCVENYFGLKDAFCAANHRTKVYSILNCDFSRYQPAEGSTRTGALPHLIDRVEPTTF